MELPHLHMFYKNIFDIPQCDISCLTQQTATDALLQSTHTRYVNLVLTSNIPEHKFVFSLLSKLFLTKIYITVAYIISVRYNIP